MSIKIKKFFREKLFENQADNIIKKYLQNLPEPPITGANAYKFYDNVPLEFRKISNKPYVPGMFKIFRKGERKLNESLKFSKSLKPEYIFNALKKRFIYLNDDNITVDIHTDKYGIPGYIIVALNIRNISNGAPETIEETFNTAGYYLAHHEPGYNTKLGGNIHWWQFEPYYWALKYKTVEDIIFHVTSNENAININKNGFIVQSTNKIYDYPPRNYFFNFPDSIQFKSFALANNKVNENNEFSVIKVDTINLEDDVIFYSDPNFIESHGIYTYENINNNHILEILNQIAK